MFTSAQLILPTATESLTSVVSKAYALLAGMKLDLFTALKEGPLTATELANVVKGDPRRLSGLLYYLVGVGLLTVSDGKFANTPIADQRLVRGRPNSLADQTGWWSESWSAYAQTAESIRAGHALAKHDYATMSANELLVLYRQFDPGARYTGEWLANTFDFTGCQTLVDVAGGSGGLAVSFTGLHPEIQATVADLPSVIPITEQFLQEAGATDRVRTVAVDLRTTPLPGSYDVAVVGNCIHLFTPEDAGRVVRSIGAAVRPGGTIYLLGYGVDDTRLAPLEGLWGNFINISFYEDAQSHTETEYRSWLEDAGFEEIDVRWEPPIGTPVLIIARKGG